MTEQNDGESIAVGELENIMNKRWREIAKPQYKDYPPPSDYKDGFNAALSLDVLIHVPEVRALVDALLIVEEGLNLNSITTMVTREIPALKPWQEHLN